MRKLQKGIPDKAYYFMFRKKGNVFFVRIPYIYTKNFQYLKGKVLKC